MTTFSDSQNTISDQIKDIDIEIMKATSNSGSEISISSDLFSQLLQQRKNALIARLKEIREADIGKKTINICGWTITICNGYYKAFKKIKGKVHGVHIGKSLASAEIKILKMADRLEKQITAEKGR